MYSKFIPLVQLRLLPELSACAEKHKLMEMGDFGGGVRGTPAASQPYCTHECCIQALQPLELFECK